MAKYAGPVEWEQWVGSARQVVRAALAQVEPIAAAWKAQPKEKGEDRTYQKSLNKSVQGLRYLQLVLMDLEDVDLLSVNEVGTSVPDHLEALHGISGDLEMWYQEWPEQAGTLSYKWQFQTWRRVRQGVENCVATLRDLPRF